MLLVQPSGATLGLSQTKLCHRWSRSCLWCFPIVLSHCVPLCFPIVPWRAFVDGWSLHSDSPPGLYWGFTLIPVCGFLPFSRGHESLWSSAAPCEGCLNTARPMALLWMGSGSRYLLGVRSAGECGGSVCVWPARCTLGLAALLGEAGLVGGPDLHKGVPRQGAWC